jgi:NAD(P)-dependent dehydrogenase (short-subunit alcohol dehydrogenase family)
MKLGNAVVLVTGANRGIGKALVEALLKNGAQKIYAAARNVQHLPNFGDNRVVPIILDITNQAQVQQAAIQANDVNILINNAGILSFGGVVTGELLYLQHDMQVNYFGTLDVVRHFAPVVVKNGGGAIANVISVVGLASMPSIGGYSASKAALFSATQAMRSELKAKNIVVHGIYPGPVDTEMTKNFPMKKTTPMTVAENIVAGIIAGTEDIFPDPVSISISKLWATNPKGVERQFSGM